MPPKDSNEHQVLRRRDLLILAVMIIAIYISFDTESLNYTIQPAWYFEQLGASQRMGRYHYLGIPPVIADIDGDGNKEVIVVTNDHFLEILNTNRDSPTDTSIYTPKIVRNIRLTSYQTLNHPIGMAVGYIDAYHPEVSRNQVIVVMTDDWTVTCYNHLLQKLWTKSIEHKYHTLNVMSHFHVEEVALLISPLAVKEGSTGIVIVGASLELNDHHSAVEVGVQVNISGSKEHPEMDLIARLEHFTVYALEAHTGHMIWKHDGSTVKPPEQQTQSIPKHILQLTSTDLSRHALLHAQRTASISDWSAFKGSLIAELPHEWHRKTDTSMRLAHFVKHHVGGGGASKTGRSAGSAVKGQSRFLGIEAPPLSASATLPHDAAEHTSHPNVVVMHHKHGLEAIGLRSGAQVTSLPLSEGKSYTDVDGDGIVDMVLVMEDAVDVASHGAAFAHEHGDLQPCTVMVVSGLPPRSQLFNGTVCVHRRTLQDPLARPSKVRNIEIKAASPLFVRNIDVLSLKESRTRDTVISINTGYTTSYSSKGEYRWQLKKSPEWPMTFHYPAVMHIDTDAARADDSGTHDSIYSHILISGNKDLMLVSTDGLELARAAIPKDPMAKPVIGDFDNDGIADIMVVTEDALLGYRVEIETSMKGLLIAFIGLCVFAGIVFFVNMKTDVIELRSGKRVIYSTFRSTDESHVD